jgi:hypothetical protein
LETLGDAPLTAEIRAEMVPGGEVQCRSLQALHSI